MPEDQSISMANGIRIQIFNFCSKIGLDKHKYYVAEAKILCWWLHSGHESRICSIDIFIEVFRP